MFFPYIHLMLTAAPPQGSWGLLEPIPAVIRRQAGKHLGQVACPSQPRSPLLHISSSHVEFTEVHHGCKYFHLQNVF